MSHRAKIQRSPVSFSLEELFIIWLAEQRSCESALFSLCNGIKLGWANAWAGSRFPLRRKSAARHRSALLPSGGVWREQAVPQVTLGNVTEGRDSRAAWCTSATAAFSQRSRASINTTLLISVCEWFCCSSASVLPPTAAVVQLQVQFYNKS